MVNRNIRSYLKLLAVTALAIFLVHVSSVDASDAVQQEASVTTE